ncbi:hypothetical protein B7P43_G14780 [Cryptotermes secundus]|uniref:Uncharacterized protein n=1 Tax=Cryptotermes secundus TaxID=105785 RepID=A0A2J7QIV3_9NEOP|nr:hypothetical protein B7P43_G14780 [Cryptotermes secundus]
MLQYIPAVVYVHKLQCEHMVILRVHSAQEQLYQVVTAPGKVDKADNDGCVVCSGQTDGLARQVQQSSKVTKNTCSTT